MKRTERGIELSVFGNALRNFLGLEPLWQDGASLIGENKPTDAERFYVRPYALPQATATSKRMST